MKPLTDYLRKNGFNYSKVHQEGTIYLYRQQVAENLYYFEVFRVRFKPARVFNGKLIQDREVFPYDEDFGRTAWSCRHFEAAMKRFSVLLEKQ